MSARTGQLRGWLTILVVLLLLAVASGSSAFSITDARMTGADLRIVGQNTVVSATITIDGVAQGLATLSGTFDVRVPGFTSSTCVASVSDGSQALFVPVIGCTPTGGSPPPLPGSSNDPMLDGDVIDPATGFAAEIVPLAPWVAPGPNNTVDVIGSSIGDVDLVLRSGILDFPGSIPAPAASNPAAVPNGVAGLGQLGVPVSFVVVPSDGQDLAVPAPPYFDGLPVLVAAFADFDGDGYIGVTHLDGNIADTATEEFEYHPVARRYALANLDRASGSLSVAAGGPPGASLRVALTAFAFAGPYVPSYWNGTVPFGPVVMTRLPFFPITDPNSVLQGGMPGFADANVLVGAKVAAAVEGDPSNPLIGESFTLRLDGSDPSIDVAEIASGPPRSLGLGQEPDPLLYHHIPQRPLRPGFDDLGNRTLFEVMTRMGLADDGPASTSTVRVVPLDLLGNITSFPAAIPVTVRVTGNLRIVSPDLDGDPSVEIVVLSDSRGVGLVIDDAAGTYDDPDGSLVVQSIMGLSQIDVFLPDPDVDDSGVVDAVDRALVAAADGLVLGDDGYDERFDLSRDTRIRKEDLAIIDANMGNTIPVP